MSLASVFGEHEYFTLDDVMAITRESREELMQRIKQYRQELIEAGEITEFFLEFIRGLCYIIDTKKEQPPTRWVDLIVK